MSLEIPDHYQVKYADTFESQIQQRQNRLAQFVNFVPNCDGKLKYLDKIEPIDVDQKTSRHEKSQMTEVETSRRILTFKSYHKMIGFDEDDDFKLGQVSVPVPQAAMELMYGGARAVEANIIAGLGGTNQVELTTDTITTEAFPSANEIAVTVGVSSGNANMPVEKVLSGIEVLMANEAFGDMNDGQLQMPSLAIGSSQFIDLLRQTRVVSSDFQPGGVSAMHTAKLEQILGCRILLTNQLTVASNIRECLLFVKECTNFGVPKSSSLLWIDNETGGIRYRVGTTAGACRNDTKGVIKLFADETIKTAATFA